jgi:hypothetical protein
MHGLSDDIGPGKAKAAAEWMEEWATQRQTIVEIGDTFKILANLERADLHDQLADAIRQAAEAVTTLETIAGHIASQAQLDAYCPGHIWRQDAAGHLARCTVCRTVRRSRSIVGRQRERLLP